MLREKKEPRVWLQLSGVDLRLKRSWASPGWVSWGRLARGMMGLGTGGQKQGNR